MKNLELAWKFQQIADLLEIEGENPFKIRAYRRAAQGIELLAEDIEALWRENRLQSLDGIGSAIAAKIEEYLESGTIRYLDELENKVPPGLIGIMAVPGIGPKLAHSLYQDLGISDLAELEEAGRAGQLHRLRGMGPKKEANILRGIDRMKQEQGRLPLPRALFLAEEISHTLGNLAEVEQIRIAGSLRRRKETVKDIDLVAASSDPEPVFDTFVSMPLVYDVLMRGDTRASVVLKNGVQVDLRVVNSSNFWATLHHFTGSAAHHVRLRERAKSKGLKINDYGLVDAKTGEVTPVDSEGELYARLGMSEVPPELREDAGEVEAAIVGTLPELITASDMCGDLHVHSTWSDGTVPIREMAEKAHQLGYEYLAICDHSQSLGIANGLSAARLAEQRREIHALNEDNIGVHVFSGTEVDILSGGELDFDDEILADLDVVVASIHSGFQQTSEKITGRMETAMKNPNVDIIGHPTGRLLGQRNPYDLEIESIVDVAAQTQTALEINASPSRLDLKDSHAKAAKDQGVRIVIDTDAHHPDEMEDMAWGIQVARRAWLEPENVVNARGKDEVENWLLRRL